MRQSGIELDPFQKSKLNCSGGVFIALQFRSVDSSPSAHPELRPDELERSLCPRRSRNEENPNAVLETVAAAPLFFRYR